MPDNAIAPGSTAVPRRQSARALRLGGRLNLAGLEGGFADLEVLGRSPLVLRLKKGGVAALFA